MTCQHMALYNNQPTFLTPFLNKATWVCLYDGCFKLKKNMTKEQLIAYGQKMNQEHRAMIHCETLEIFCTVCRKEIFDASEEIEGSPSKHKKIKKANPKMLRQYLLTSNESQNKLFAGNSQYPPSFQKEKRGLCGLKHNGINSYLNSVIHLLAYLPTIIDIAKSVDFDKIDSQIVRLILENIEKIWSGKFRVISIDKIQMLLMEEDQTFLSYLHKSPQYVLYFILKKLLEEFYFQQLPCKAAQMIIEPYSQWQSEGTKKYTLLKQIFGGSCHLQKICSACTHKDQKVSRFECLKLTYESHIYSDANYKGNLLALIEEALNWRNSHQEKTEGAKLKCQKCGQKIKQLNSYVDLPNNLILEFGQELNGLNVELPNQIDLFKFTSNPSKAKQNCAAVYDFLGCISRNNKRFSTQVKHLISKKYFSFQDESIQQCQRPHSNIKIALYKRRQNVKHKPLQRNILSCLEVNINPVVPLPDFWSIFLKEHYDICPLMNPFICQHGKIKPSTHLSKMKNGPQKIPVEVYQYLLQVFGGRKIAINQNEQKNCQKCQQKLQALKEIKASQKQLAAFADKLSCKKNWVFIKRSWLQEWKNFVYSQNKKGYKICGYPRPGQINNQEVVGEQMSITYKKIAQQIWYFLQKFYGGGPRLQDKSYHPNSVVKTSINLRFDSLRQNFELLKIKNDRKSTQKMKNQIKQVDQQNQTVVSFRQQKKQ